MKSDFNRKKEIFKGVLPPYGTEEYYAYIEFLKEKTQKNPISNKFLKDAKAKVIASLEAQSLSHCNFLTEKTLRHFLFEFNNRAWRFGLRSMSSMFNIVEAFFNYRKPEIYFELIEEENYEISFFEFVDFITNKDFQNNIALIKDNLSEDIIYNFNVKNDDDEIKFKSDSKEDFIISGISIIRRDNEVTVLAISGKQQIEPLKINFEDYTFDTDNPDKVELIEEFKENLSKQKIEYEYLDPEKKYSKVLIACRIDLETLTIDAKYVAKETTVSFEIVTDEIDRYLDLTGNFSSSNGKSDYQEIKKKVDEYSAIFEVIKMSLYLPYYFNFNEEDIIEENLETEFKNQFSNPIHKRRFSNTFGYKSSIKPLYTLKHKTVIAPDKVVLRDDLFKIEISGYWKKLEVDEIGLDKNGNQILGKTWVNQNLSWFEAKVEDLTIELKSEKFTGVNAGYIYMMRNPTMEKNIFKIGLTTKTSDERAGQLSKTSVADKFYVSQEWNVKDCKKAEMKIHTLLNRQRIDPRREFFKIDNYTEAVSIINQVVKEINCDLK